MKIVRSLSDKTYKKILDAAPDYVDTLVGSEWLRLEVHEDGPALAWTRYDSEHNRFVVCFHKDAATMSDRALSVLWRHEIGHVSLAHFQKQPCLPENMGRSIQEMMVVGDIHINSYLDDKEAMYEVGATSKKMHDVKDPEVAESKGYIDPEEWLPKIGLDANGEYPYEIIHGHFHEWLDKELEQSGGGEGSASGPGGMDGNGACGGIQQVDDDSGMAEASASVVSGVASEGGDDGIGESWGKGGSMGKVRLATSDLPDWMNALESFARSIVEVVLAEKRSHTRPQEVYKSYDVHVPTMRPRWDYQPAQVCFLVDTSGSMLHELKYVGPVIEYLSKHNIKTRLIAGDTRVTFDELIDRVPPAIVGGGGTEILPLWERAMDYSPESIVFFTDGYVPAWPKDEGLPTLWVGCKQQPPFGTWAK